MKMVEMNNVLSRVPGKAAQSDGPVSCCVCRNSAVFGYTRRRKLWICRMKRVSEMHTGFVVKIQILNKVEFGLI